MTTDKRDLIRLIAETIPTLRPWLLAVALSLGIGTAVAVSVVASVF